MAEFKITRFRYTWKGNWSNDSITYYKDDVIFYQGAAWVCIRQHISDIFDDAQTFIQGEETNPSPAWVKTTEGRTFLGEWTTDTRYDPGTLILIGGNVYLCVSSHASSANFNIDLIKWEIFAVGSNFRNEWEIDTRYQIGDVIRYNGYTYQCVLEHVSGSIEEGIIVGNNDSIDDSTAETWKIVVENYTYIGEYQSSTRYKINDLVKYGGSILKCIEEYTSSSITGNIDSTKFQTYLSGFEYTPNWQDNIYYALGDVIAYGGVLYIASENNYDSEPGYTNVWPSGNPFWTVIVQGRSFKGQYDPQSGILYKAGDVVRRGASLWLSIVSQQSDDSSLSPFDDTNWELIISAYNYSGSWDVDTDYNLNDVVYFKGTTYYANIPHRSDFSNFPGDNGEGFEYWTVMLVGEQNAALSNLGDLLTYNLSRNIIEDGSSFSIIGDESTIDHTSVAIGSTNQLLVVEDNAGSIGYKTWGNIQRLFYVSTTGVDVISSDIDDPNRGLSYFKPWRTVRFALEQTDDGFLGRTSIIVRTGTYEEFLPLIIPAGTSIVGEELRSTSIVANSPIESLANDAPYTIETIIRLGLIISDVVAGIETIPSPGNLIPQNTNADASNGDINAINGIWADIVSALEFKINGVGTWPTVTGSNTQTTNSARLVAVTALENNREFLKAEAIAYMQFANPLYEFNTTKCERDIDRFISAAQYDLEFPGNYKSTLAARYYANAVIGSQLEDMFYVRDTTGIRNLTLKGLSGTLPALQEGEVYRIPTAGAYVSLDPGWGPDDERVWVINRSCYIQNVTTFGTGAVGQKIDGDLHNGGNKSIVSNDFTQVISDGIGAWVTNGGRAELVSVFTYYAHIGMFAKDGGIIRATNGNSSYGDYGTLADGLDPDETPVYASLNTRTEQATVVSAYAGEVNDYILGLEFSNCGQSYTTAEYIITSSGSGAFAIQEEFRDNGMFVAYQLNGGSGFSQYGNQAQLGSTTNIILASSENVTEEQILGMRIIIISGEGTGQYGYVQAYNSVTKNCTVYRESDNRPGWDHVNPGTPSRALLTTGSRYRIEPRIEFNDPGFTATEESQGVASAWAAAVYGETSNIFTEVEGTRGTGDVIGVVPASAQFTVTKTGRQYAIEITSGGAGYQVNDVVTIDGAAVGGITLEHDIELTVLTVSDDSTNSILTYRITNTPVADSGKFVLTPPTGHFARYSSDGETWSSTDLPEDGNWKCLAAGDNKFVAISNGTNRAASSTDGIEWTARSMPSSRNWNSVVYGKPSNSTTGLFVAVADNLNAGAFSTNGTTWTATTLPGAEDSTLQEYVDIAYGRNVFVALANSNNSVAAGTYDEELDTITWQQFIMDVINDSSSKDWVSIAYGNRRFVAISSTGDVAYSFDGEVWYPAAMPTQDGSTAHNWKQIRYGQGVFFAVGDTGSKDVGADPTTGPSTFAATSYDGIVWTNRELASELDWGVVAFGNPDITLNDSSITNSKPTWIIAPLTSSNFVNRVYTGTRTIGRVVVEGTGVSSIKIWEPGSGYTSDPVPTFTDPGKTVDPIIRVRTADGVLAQPTFVQTGQAYKTSTTSVAVIGDGFSDQTPRTKFITVDGIQIMPRPGAQFYIGGREGYFVAVVTDINAITLEDGTIRSTFQVSPIPKLIDFLEHGMEVIIREKYSQVRVTGHDFLDIGSGNFENTNYPQMYSDYAYNVEPFQEVYNMNGGRVFYTSTDQNGNFRAGEQFAVEQATGIITISADFFDLAGLTEIRLGGITVGSTAVIREFSKDPLFQQNSNTVIPTQRAIRSYLQSRLNIGGEDLLTPSIIAGTVRVGPNLIDSSAGLSINFPVLADFSGAGAGISGSILGQAMFFRGFRQF